MFPEYLSAQFHLVFQDLELFQEGTLPSLESFLNFTSVGPLLLRLEIVDVLVFEFKPLKMIHHSNPLLLFLELFIIIFKLLL